MPSDPARWSGPVDAGFLTPVTAGTDIALTDAAYLAALVTAEVALTRAWKILGYAPADAAALISAEFGWRGQGELCEFSGVDVGELADRAIAGGNPVIPLVLTLRAALPPSAQLWLHRGATSQDILDSASMLIARRAAAQIFTALDWTIERLGALAREHRATLSVARTLTQQAVPTTIGLRFSGWLNGVRRARQRLAEVASALPASLGGAGGTLASFAEIAGTSAAAALPALYAEELGLATPEAPWHTSRWPITELADALVQVIDALGKIAADVATLSRTEIAELSEGTGGGSSAMPQKRNPVESVLIRSAALRAPQLGATLHLAAALAGDERPDGAWHAEWPTLRELLRLALGAASHGVSLSAHLRVDAAAAARNLGTSRGLVVSERLSIVLAPVLGAGAVQEIISAVNGGADLAETVRSALAGAALDGDVNVKDVNVKDIDVDDLVDPARYTGLAVALVDDAGRGDRTPEAGG